MFNDMHSSCNSGTVLQLWTLLGKLHLFECCLLLISMSAPSLGLEPEDDLSMLLTARCSLLLSKSILSAYELARLLLLFPADCPSALSILVEVLAALLESAPSKSHGSPLLHEPFKLAADCTAGCALGRCMQMAAVWSGLGEKRTKSQAPSSPSGELKLMPSGGELASKAEALAPVAVVHLQLWPDSHASFIVNNMRHDFTSRVENLEGLTKAVELQKHREGTKARPGADASSHCFHIRLFQCP